jgi:hypothetical protein
LRICGPAYRRRGATRRPSSALRLVDCIDHF